MSKFRLLDRGRSDAMLLIPGWAFDYRIFASLSIGFNYLLPVEYSRFQDFAEGLLTAMEKNNLKKISILGWSMGGLLAFDLLSRYKDKVDNVIFVSVKGRYEKEHIENMKRSLKKNRRAFLYKFYNNCFSGDELQTIGWFEKRLLKGYLERMNLNLLLDGLDYLLRNEINPRILNSISSVHAERSRAKIKFVHGSDDKIVPIDEARKLKDDLPQAEFIVIEKTGHLAFLNPNFARIFDD